MSIPTVAPQFRPFTADIAPAVLSLIRLATPAHTSEHLVQGWDALVIAGQATDPAIVNGNMAFARKRLEGARHALRYVKWAGKQALAAAEVEHFARLIEATR